MSNELYNAYHEKITLTKEQEACLNYTGERTLMVKGLAGAGKSLVLQGLAKKLMAGYSADKRNKVAIFTFSNTLNSATREFLEINGEKEDYITVATLNSHIYRVYTAIGAPKLKIYSGKLYDDNRKETLKTAFTAHETRYGHHRFHDLYKEDQQFWLDEFDWMKDMNVAQEDMEYYLGLPRTGRGGKVRMSASDRVTAFQLFALYDHEMKKKGQGEWIDQALYLVRHADQIPDQYKFEHILIDEAQDLSLVYMMAAMMFFKKDMVVAMDMNQRIYNKHWTPKQLGIETTTKKLTKSMRTTKQIDELAESIRKHNDEFLSDDDKPMRAIPELEGPLPRLIRVEDIASEKKYVTELVKAYLAQKSNISIGIIASKKAQMDTFAAWMTDANIYHEIIRKDSPFSMAKPGVKIVNVYNAKGLEFTRVIIPQFVEGNYPYRYSSTDEEEMQMFLAKSRNLIYVAMTRAKYSVDVVYSGKYGSRFIGEMDPSLYEVGGLSIEYYKPIGGYGGYNANREERKNVVTPPIAPIPAQNKGQDLKGFLESKGLEVIDKRPMKGALWVVGEKSKISAIIDEVGKLYGAYGHYSAGGGRATKNRAGWFTNCKK